MRTKRHMTWTVLRLANSTLKPEPDEERITFLVKYTKPEPVPAGNELKGGA